MRSDDTLTARLLAAAFIIYGLLGVALLAVCTPPFQNPDESNHLAKAVQVADGTFLSSRFVVAAADGTSVVLAGGRADPGPFTASVPFNPLVGNNAVRVARTAWAPEVRWSSERPMLNFPNTAMYPPLLYVPPAIGVEIGRLAGWTVTRTLILSRLINGILAVAIGAVAVFAAGAEAVWLFAILALPMSLAVMASVSQDSLSLAFGALAGTMLLRLRRESARPKPLLITLVVTLVLIATAKPPYAPLALVVLGIPTLRWRTRLLVFAVIAACVGGWLVFGAAATYTDFGRTLAQPADPAAQVALLMEHPARIFVVVVRTLGDSWKLFLEEFTGRLGWLDTGLGRPFRWIATGMLVVAGCAASLVERRDPAGPLGRPSVAAGVLLAGFGMMASLYVSWTAPGAPLIEGVQGRYFLPLALIGVAVLPAFVAPRLRKLRAAMLVVVVAFPIFSLVTTVWAVIDRYYLT